MRGGMVGDPSAHQLLPALLISCVGDRLRTAQGLCARGAIPASPAVDNERRVFEQRRAPDGVPAAADRAKRAMRRRRRAGEGRRYVEPFDSRAVHLG